MCAFKSVRDASITRAPTSFGSLDAGSRHVLRPSRFGVTGELLWENLFVSDVRGWVGISAENPMRLIICVT